MKPTALISTVGVSLIGHLEKSEEFRRLMKDQKWSEIAKRLQKKDPSDISCGAEINTLHALIEQRELVDRDVALHFCLSDTQKGKQMGDILENYYEKRGYRSVKPQIIEGLQDQDEDLFRRVGLRRLVQKIAEITHNVGGPDFVAINATGGYKAQIALSAIIGQAMGVTVYYKHEMFPGIISLPPMPIAFDFDILGREAGILLALEVEDCVPINEEPDAALLPLLEDIEVDGARYYGLSAMGQLYLEGFRLRYPADKTLPEPVSDQERKQPAFRDDHYPQGFQDYVNRVWRETPYIITCRSLPYDKQRGIGDRVFYIRSHDDEIVGEYQDKDRFGARFSIQTHAKSKPQKLAVVDNLTNRFGRK
jgi:putative CRISPR-associated protein (TIGR02619 family)